jgi:hypothetical protein
MTGVVFMPWLDLFLVFVSVDPIALLKWGTLVCAGGALVCNGLTLLGHLQRPEPITGPDATLMRVAIAMYSAAFFGYCLWSFHG